MSGQPIRGHLGHRQGSESGLASSMGRVLRSRRRPTALHHGHALIRIPCVAGKRFAICPVLMYRVVSIAEPERIARFFDPVVAPSPTRSDHGFISIEAVRMYDTFWVPLANNLRLECHAQGSQQAPVVLFLHGFPEGPGIWDDLMDTMQGRFYCVAPDLRIYRSGAPVEIEASQHAQLDVDMGALAQSLHSPIAALVVHDWGGSLAWTLAAQAPTWLQHLEIVNSPQPATLVHASLDDTQQQHASAYMDFLCRPQVERARDVSDFERLWQFFDGIDAAGGEPSEVRPMAEATRQRYRDAWQRGLTGPLDFYRTASPARPSSHHLLASIASLAAPSVLMMVTPFADPLSGERKPGLPASA